MIGQGQRWDVLAAIAGVLFAVLLFVSVAAVDPLREASDQELLDWWTTASNQQASITSMVARLLACPLFLVFLARLRTRLRAVEPDGTWSDLVYGLGGVMTALLALSALGRGYVALAMRAGNEPAPGADMLRYQTELAYQTYSLLAIPCAALLMLAASALVLRTRVVARWVGWAGIACGAAGVLLTPLLLSAFASPLVSLWVAGMSYQLWRTRGALPAGSVAPASGLPADARAALS